MKGFGALLISIINSNHWWFIYWLLANYREFDTVAFQKKILRYWRIREQMTVEKKTIWISFEHETCKIKALLVTPERQKTTLWLIIFPFMIRAPWMNNLACSWNVKMQFHRSVWLQNKHRKKKKAEIWVIKWYFQKLSICCAITALAFYFFQVFDFEFYIIYVCNG